MTPMNPTQSQPTSLDRVVALDERTITGFANLAVSIYTAATTGAPVDQHRDGLLAALADEPGRPRRVRQGSPGPRAREDPTIRMLTSAMAAQHRSLAARVEELAHATTGLDAVAITRTIHAILNLTLDLAHRVLDHLAAHDVGLPARRTGGPDRSKGASPVTERRPVSASGAGKRHGRGGAKDDDLVAGVVDSVPRS